MDKQGTVVKTDKNYAIVCVEREAACGSCGVCSERGLNDLTLRLPNVIHAAPGERVNISIKSNSVLYAALIVYLIPLLALIAGVLTGTRLALQFGLNPELFGIIAGIVFTSISFVIIKISDRFLASLNFYDMKISVINNSISGGDEKDGSR